MAKNRAKYHLNKKLKNILKIDIDYFFKGGSYTLIQQVFGTLSGVAISFSFSRLANNELFGKYNLILSLFTLASVFSLSGFPTAIMQATLKKYEKALLQSVYPRVKSSFLGVIFLLLIGFFYFFLKNQKDVGLSLIIASFLMPVFYSFNGWLAYLQAKKLFQKATFYSTLESLIIASAISVVLLIKKDILVIILVYFLVYSVLNFIFFQKSAALISSRAKQDPHILPYASYLTFISILGLITSNIDKIIIANLVGYSQLAFYSIAQIIYQGIIKNLKAIIALPIIKIIPHNMEKNIQDIKKHFWKIIFFGCSISILGWLLSPLFIRFMYGKTYQQSIFYTQALMINFIFTPINLLWQNIVVLQKQSKQILFLSFFPALPKIFLYLLFAPFLKIWGIIIAEIISSLMLFGYFCFYFCQIKKK